MLALTHTNPCNNRTLTSPHHPLPQSSMVWPTIARAHFHQYSLGDLLKARHILLRCLHQSKRNHSSNHSSTAHFRSHGAANAPEHEPVEGQGQGLGQWGQGQGLDLEVDLQLDSDSDEESPIARGVSTSSGIKGAAGVGVQSRAGGLGAGLGLEGGEESSHGRTRRSERTALLTALAYVCLEMDDDASAYRSAPPKTSHSLSAKTSPSLSTKISPSMSTKISPSPTSKASP